MMMPVTVVTPVMMPEMSEDDDAGGIFVFLVVFKASEPSERPGGITAVRIGQMLRETLIPFGIFTSVGLCFDILRLHRDRNPSFVCSMIDFIQSCSHESLWSLRFRFIYY